MSKSHSFCANVKLFHAIAFFTTFALPAFSQRGTPATMKKIVVSLQAPDLQHNAFSALPKTLYIAGSRYIRIEDPPDARQGIQKLTIINGVDAYSANLIGRTGTHARNASDDSELRTPIVLPFDPNHKLGILDELEFGDELAFFKDAGAVRKPGVIINAKPTDAFVLEQNGITATLTVRSVTQTPVKISWQPGSEGQWTYEYIVDEQIPFDAKLFAKPDGIRFKEMPTGGENEGL